MNRTKVKIEIFNDGKMPIYASECSAGCDVFAAKDINIEPGQTVCLPLNIKFALENGVEAQVRPRSGLSLKTALRVPNSPGTIDADYRDEVCVILTNEYSKENLIEELKSGRLDTDKIKKISAAEYLGVSTEQLDAVGMADEIIVVDVSDRLRHGTIRISKGDRIAQIVFAKYCMAEFEQVERVADIGKNRGGGFGHTGI